MIAFVQNAASHLSDDLAQNAQIRRSAQIQRAASQMARNISSVIDLILNRPRHRRNRTASASAIVSIRGQNLIDGGFIRIKIANVAFAVTLDQIVHRRRLTRGRTITARNVQISARSLKIRIG